MAVAPALSNHAAPSKRAYSATAEPLEVLAAGGEPFLRVSSGGVLANLASPDWYSTATPEGDPQTTRPPRQRRWGQPLDVPPEAGTPPKSTDSATSPAPYLGPREVPSDEQHPSGSGLPGRSLCVPGSK